MVEAVKSREFMKIIEGAGGQFLKTKGDHHVFRLPNGRFIDVPHGGRQTEVAMRLVARFRRLTRSGP